MSPAEFREAALYVSLFFPAVGTLRFLLAALAPSLRCDDGEEGCFAIFTVAVGAVIYLACEAVLQVAMHLPPVQP